MTIRDLRALVSLLSDSVDAIERVCASRNSAFPSLDGVVASEPSSVLADTEIQAASKVIVAAASQLVAFVQPPQTTVFNAGTSVRGYTLLFIFYCNRPLVTSIISLLL